jgi:hypothetical protein
MGIESFEWFELDIFGLPKQFFSLPVVEVTFNITTQYEIINNCHKNLTRIYITQSLSEKICLYLYNTEQGPGSPKFWEVPFFWLQSALFFLEKNSLKLPFLAKVPF